MSKLIKLSKLAKDLGVSKNTIYNWHKAGKIEFIKTPTGRNFVSEETYNSLLGIIKNIDDDGNQRQ